MQNRKSIKFLSVWLCAIMFSCTAFTQMTICEPSKISSIRVYNATSDTVLIHIIPNPVFSTFDLAPPYQQLLPGDTTQLASLEWAGAFKVPTTIFEFIWVGGFSDLDMNLKSNWKFYEKNEFEGEYIFTISHFVYADRPDFAHFKPIILAPTVPEDTTVYETYMLEKEGGYPGGVQQLKTDLEKHFASFTDDYEIRYFYEFVIEKNGSASHFKVLRGEVEAIHKHVKAFVENAQWTPGIYREKPVRSKLVVPVRLVR